MYTSSSRLIALLLLSHLALENKWNMILDSYIKLQNGVRIFLVSDLETEMSAAALDIKVGSFSDPANLQGLSHLCEHVLFTGSESFPKESYSEYLDEKGGSSNAFTTSEHTNFYFEVPSEHFTEALKRFISYFESPVFRENAINRELDIIESEHEKNRFNDVWRTNQVERATANPNHVFSRFSTGSKATLNLSKCSPGRNLRYEIYNFYKSNYSANLMTVCLIHSGSLDEMEESAQSLFSVIVNKNIPECIWPAKPFRAMKSKTYIVPVKDILHLNMTFCLEDLSRFYSASPEGILAQLIGHKGPGSLFSYLKRQGYANHIIASHRCLASGFAFFLITVQLSPGNESRVDEVIKIVFQYIKLLKEKGPQRWFFDEIKMLSIQQFEYKDMEKVQGYGSSIATWLHLYDIKDILCGDYIINNWRPDLVDHVLSCLRPDNVRITLLSKQNVFITTQVENHFGTDYHIEKIPEPVVNSWKTVPLHPDLTLPHKNEFIIMNEISLVPYSSREKHLPDLIADLERIRTRVWFLPSTSKYEVPNSYLFFKFSSMESNSDARKSALNHLFVFLIRDALVEFSYVGELAGIFYVLKASKWGLELIIKGYSEKQPLYLISVLKEIYNTTFSDENRFKEIFDAHVKCLENSEAESLKIQSKHFLGAILCQQTFDRSDRLKALKSISLSDVRHFALDFLDKHSLEAFFYGNLTLETANSMLNSLFEAKLNYLKMRAEGLGLNIDETPLPHLEEWFLKDPVQKIVLYENAICKRRSAPNGVKYNPVDEGLYKNANNNNESSTLASLLDSSPIIFQSIEEYKLPRQSQNLCLVSNEIQSSSCVLFYLQYEIISPLNSIIIDLFHHLTRAKLLSYLKHVVPLGYVVHCDIRSVNRTLGYRVLIESQYPLHFIYDTINQGLESLESFLNDCVGEELFNATRKSISIHKKENRIRMQDEAPALWKEIMEQTYDFRRNEKEIDLLEEELDPKVTLETIKGFYKDWVSLNGSERRCLIVSIGPDPILNQMDFIPSFGLHQIPFVRRDWSIFQLLDPSYLQEWFKMVFNSQDNEYEPPKMIQPTT
ncbi:insulin-degrading enzyme isoform X2 [Lepeophtheirus salmonis]|uniref:insulin-degrading enzyme isoform X2 n=1 Tax=Lepeophtheirus salmonis TaxID=72036 RepID=UPI003AF35BF7